MIKAASTYTFVRQRLSPGLLEGLQHSGAEAIEIFCSRAHFDYCDRGAVRELALWFKSSGVAFHSMHSPMFYDQEVWGHGNMDPVSIAETDRKRQIAAMDEIKRALEVAEVAPFRFLVQHIGNSNEGFSERKFDAVMTSVEHLRAFAKPLGVTLLLENIPNDLSTPEKLNELIKTAHFTDVGFCFDTGHAHLADGVFRVFEALKHNIRSTHVHDNSRDKDSHLVIGKGTIDWTECAALLASAPHRPPLLLELEGEEGAASHQRMAQSFENFAQAQSKAALLEPK